MRRSTAGRAGTGSSPRPNGPAARPIGASSSPRSMPPRPLAAFSTTSKRRSASSWRLECDKWASGKWPWGGGWKTCIGHKYEMLQHEFFVPAGLLLVRQQWRRAIYQWVRWSMWTSYWDATRCKAASCQVADERRLCSRESGGDTRQRFGARRQQARTHGSADRDAKGFLHDLAGTGLYAAASRGPTTSQGVPWLVHHQRKSVEPFAHVGVARRQPHPHARRDWNHRRNSASTTRAGDDASTSAPTRIRSPLLSTISTRPTWLCVADCVAPSLLTPPGEQQIGVDAVVLRHLGYGCARRKALGDHSPLLLRRPEAALARGPRIRSLNCLILLHR
jgi:hypothetical protein